MKNKKLLLSLCVMLFISANAIGCAPARRPVPETTPNQRNINNRTTTDNNLPRVDETLPRDNRTITDNRTTIDDRTDVTDRINGDLTDRAEKIADEVEKLDEVKSATVVITENTALVGINMTAGTKGSLNAQIKKQVEDAVKKVDKEIDRVAVTADPDLFTRIGNIARDIGEGRPLSGFGKEVEEIIRRITPGS